MKMWTHIGKRLWRARQHAGQRVLDAAASLLFAQPPARPKHILIVRLGALGDGVRVLPALTALRRRWPAARLSLLTHTGRPGRVRLDQLLPSHWFHEVMDYTERPWPEVWRWLRARSFDLLVALPPWGRNLHRHLRDMVFFRLAGIPSAIGWQYDPTPRPARATPPPADLPTEDERLLDILRKHGISPPEAMPWLSPNGSHRARIEALLARHDLSSRSFLVLAPGASRTWNRWPPERFARVAAAFAERYPIVVIGGHEDRAAGRWLHHATSAIDLCGQLDPLDTAALLARARLCLANDSGPAHLARAVGCPTVVLSSAWEWPGRWFRPRAGLVVIRHDELPCRWCHTGCKEAACIQAISVEEVLAAAERLLRQRDGSL